MSITKNKETVHMKKIIWLSLLALLVSSTALWAEDLPYGRQCSMQGNWKELFARDGITVYSQRLEGSRLVAFRAEAVLEAPVGQMLEVLRRVDIIDEWMPDTREKYVLQVNSDLDIITYSLTQLPFPFAHREMVLRNSAWLDRERKYLVMDLYSVEFDGQPVKKRAVRAHMHCGEMNARPISERSTEVSMLLYVDPKGLIPAWLANMFQKKLPYNFLRALEKKASITDFEVRPQFQRLVKDLEAILE